jgi:hypothetical protein
MPVPDYAKFEEFYQYLAKGGIKMPEIPWENRNDLKGFIVGKLMANFPQNLLDDSINWFTLNHYANDFIMSVLKSEKCKKEILQLIKTDENFASILIDLMVNSYDRLLENSTDC